MLRTEKMEHKRIMKRVFILVLSMMLALSGGAGIMIGEASAETVDDMAKQILGSQQVDEILSSFPEAGEPTETPTMTAEQEAQAAQEAAEEEAAEAQAEEEAAAGGELIIENFQYVVTPVKPANQASQLGSFDLRMNPADKQTITVEVRNTGNVEMTVDVTVEDAFSNANGVIQYGAAPSTTDEVEIPDAMKLTDYVTTEDSEITLAPGESKMASFEIQMPEEEYDGTILGGLVFIRRPLESEMGGSGGMGIINQYSYAVGLRLHENDNKVEPAFELVSVEPNIRESWGNTTTMTITNPVPLLINAMDIRLEVFASGDLENPVAQGGSNLASFAPSTAMAYNVMMAELLPQGDYLARVTIGIKDSETMEVTEEFVLEKEFSVSAEEAEGVVRPTPEPVVEEEVAADDAADETPETDTDETEAPEAE